MKAISTSIDDITLNRKKNKGEISICLFVYVVRVSVYLIKGCLKLVSTIFYQIFIFSPNDSPLKTVKNVFISSKKVFSFSRYSKFCDFLPSFPHFPDSKRQIEVE